MGDHDCLSSPESNAAQGKVQTRILEHRHAGKTDDWKLCQFRYVAELSETGMAERLRYWNSLETAQNTVQLELRFSPLGAYFLKK